MSINIQSGILDRILLIEPCLSLLTCLKEFIESAGPFQVVEESQDGIQALEYLSQIAPDIVVINLNLYPAKDLEFIQAVHQSHPQIVVVALSLHMEDEYFQKKCCNEGAWACLPLPCSFELFQQTLKDCRKRSFQELSYP